MIRRVLVVKLAALGDFVQAFGPFATIRAAHPDAEITLLTTKPYAELAVASPWFDHVWIDDKPKWWQWGKVAVLKDRLRQGRFDRVYDLQTSDRSGWYFRLMGGRVQWSGIAKGCALPHANPRRDFMHTLDRQAEQLAMAGLAPMVAPDLAWADADIGRFGLPRPFALLCPGGARHRPGKRWPAAHFGQLAAWLAARGIMPVLLGTKDEQAEIDAVVAACPQAVALTGRTSFQDILGLARQARLAVGNDTGPMHLIAAAGCPGLVLFGPDSDPDLCAPRGPVRVVRVPDLAGLAVDDVQHKVTELLS
ncbi:putative Glycosyl transferase, family 9 [Magnetospirillum sp. LM-5]|uniref:glycosyltransferase family 9 protein n=1 Tax=Magnetospirillum sp. LM-5 TaxID=2681466 RepID=UPI00138136E5|nr:putative Glycosyl transferase, family 9 [Magnetospirillum sp. LM-5]